MLPRFTNHPHYYINIMPKVPTKARFRSKNTKEDTTTPNKAVIKVITALFNNNPNVTINNIIKKAYIPPSISGISPTIVGVGDKNKVPTAIKLLVTYLLFVSLI